MSDPPPAAPARDHSSDPAHDQAVRQELQRMTRRSFATGGVAALLGAAGLGWLKSAPPEGGIPWPLRRMLEFNARLAQAVFPEGRRAPTFDPSQAKEPRVNGRLGLAPKIDPRRWRLNLLGPGAAPAVERALPLAAVRELPRHEMVAEFKCVEGWSQVVQWAGARLSDFIARFGRDTPYVGLATPDGEYYVGLDRRAAQHEQTLLAYEMNGRPLTPEHGAPLRLVCAVKYGVKSIKRLGAIQFTDLRPADYWAERGYDWHLDH